MLWVARTVKFTSRWLLRKFHQQKQPAVKVSADQLLNLSIHSLPLRASDVLKPSTYWFQLVRLSLCSCEVIIGLKTSGTFMPVLIAVAFVQTQLVTRYCWLPTDCWYWSYNSKLLIQTQPLARGQDIRRNYYGNYDYLDIYCRRI